MGDQNFMSGLMGGLAQGLQHQQEVQLKKEYQKSLIDINKLHGKLFEAQAKAAELKTQGLPQNIIEALNATERDAGMVTQMATQGPGGAPGAQAPEAVAAQQPSAPMWGPGSLPRQMAGGQVQIPGDPANNISVRQNNPFNLKYVGQPDAIGSGARGFSIYETPEAGVQAGIRQIQLDQSRGLPFAQFAEKYAPAVENPGWAQDVAKLAGITDPNTPINQIPTMKLAQAVAWRESQTQLPSGDLQQMAQGQPSPGPLQPPGQQLITPNFPKPIGISKLKLGERLALDVYFKQTYDLDTKFRETKGKFKLHGNPYDGFQITNEDTGQTAIIPSIMQKNTRYEFTTPSGAGGFGYAPEAIRTPSGGGGAMPGGGAGPIIMNKPPEVSYTKQPTAEGGFMMVPTPKAQIGGGGFTAEIPPTQLPGTIPEATRTKIGETNAIIDQLNIIKDTFKPEYVGAKGMAGKAADVVSGLPGAQALNLGDPARATWNTFYSEMLGQKLHQRGGSALTKQEIAYIQATLPKLTHSPELFKAGIEGAKLILQASNFEIMAAHLTPDKAKYEKAATDLIQQYKTNVKPMMEQGAKAGKISGGVPPGSVYIGTSDGKKVYRTPDGKGWIE